MKPLTPLFAASPLLALLLACPSLVVAAEGTPASAPAGSVSTLTLSEATQKALAQNGEIDAAKKRTRSGEETYKSAWGRYLPKVDLEARYTHLNDDITIDLSPIRTAMIASSLGAAQAGQAPAPALQGLKASLESSLPPFESQIHDPDFFNAAVTLTQPLFTGGKLSAATHASREAWKGAEIEETDTKEKIVTSVAEAYSKVILAETNAGVRRDLVKGLTEHQRISENLLKGGQITKAAKMKADLALNEAQRELLKADEDAKLARSYLSFLLGEDVSQVTLSTPLQISGEIKSLDEYKSLASRNNKSLQIVDHKLSQLEDKRKIARSAFMPTVAAFGRYEILKDELTVLEPEWYVGVGVKMNIFSGGEDAHALESVRAEQYAAESMRRYGEEGLKVEVHRAYSELVVAQNQHSSATQAVSLAEEGLRLNTASYKTGVARSIDVTDSYNDLARARLAEIKALYDYSVALHKLNKLTGSISLN